MADFCKENRCHVCPKAFCCPTCRRKHEHNIHKTNTFCDLCTRSSRPLLPNTCKHILSSNRCSLSHVSTTMPKIPEVPNTAEEGFDPPGQDRRKVEKFVMNYGESRVTSCSSTNKEVESKCFDRDTHQESNKQYTMQMGITSTPLQTNFEKESRIFNKMIKSIKKVGKLPQNEDDLTSTDYEKLKGKYNDDNITTEDGRLTVSFCFGSEENKINFNKSTSSLQYGSDNYVGNNPSSYESSTHIEYTGTENSNIEEKKTNYDSQESECFGKGQSREINNQYSLGATSTPIPINIEQRRTHFKKTIKTLQGSNEQEEGEHNCFENYTPVDQRISSRTKKIQIDEDESGINRSKNLKTTKRVSFDLTPSIEPFLNYKKSGPTETIATSNEKLFFSPVTYTSCSSPEERDNELNALSCSKATINTTIWESANSFSEETEEWVCASNKTHSLNQKHDRCDSEDPLELNLISTKLLEGASVGDNYIERNSSVEGDESNICHISLSSASNISHSIWQTISNSIKSALNSTKEICSFSEQLPKRALDESDDIGKNLSSDEPMAKRRKYEPIVKCRPPIHDMDMILYLTVNNRSVLLISKSTQTEQCYFT